jgi:cation diffusion facilitator CzcD-associated flavoprotein CzcO
MAKTTAHITMLQRSPTYVAWLPSRDGFADLARQFLPEEAAYAATRWKNVFRGIFFFELSRRQPGLMKMLLRKVIERTLGPDFDVDTHFTPRYDPWDERLCVAPDGDFFRAIRKKRASIVTDQIETFTENGILLRSGKQLDADIIVTATGLNAKVLSGVKLTVDGRSVEASQVVAYKGMMYSDIPNLASAFGYTNASWTLKCDLTAEHVCRVLNHMSENGFASVTPRLRDPSMPTEPLVDLKSGYVRRALGTIPKQGSRAPWRLHQNYIKDLLLLRFGRVAEEELEFAVAIAPAKRKAHEQATERSAYSS